MKTTHEHTPGPWLIEAGQQRLGVAPASDPHAALICDVYPCDLRAGLGETDHANARLIAAAPELLAALQYARGIIYEGRHSGPDAVRLIDCALANATGIASESPNGSKLSDDYWPQKGVAY